MENINPATLERPERPRQFRRKNCTGQQKFRRSLEHSREEVRHEEYHANLIQEKYLKIFIEAGPYSKHSTLELVNSCSGNLKEGNVFGTTRIHALHNRLLKASVESKIDRQSARFLIKLIQDKEIEETLVIPALRKLVTKSEGFNIKCMTLILAVCFCSALGNYRVSFEFLDQLRYTIQGSKYEELFVVYLKLTIITLMNIRDYVKAEQYLHKMTKISWLFSFQEVELWSYLQLSLIYLERQEIERSQVMQDKYEQGLVEPHESHYRQYCVEKIQEEIARIREKSTDFELANEDLNYKLIHKKSGPVVTEQAFNQDMKLFRRMLIRMPTGLKINNLQRILTKVSHERLRREDEHNLKSNVYINHTSKLRNMNNYFRDSNHQQLITIEDPSKNWPLFKEIMRRIAMEYACGQSLRTKTQKVKEV